MEHVGIDLRKNQRQIGILADAGELVHMRLHTKRSRFTAEVRDRPDAQGSTKRRQNAPGSPEAWRHKEKEPRGP